jgi:hypothetical protein
MDVMGARLTQAASFDWTRDWAIALASPSEDALTNTRQYCCAVKSDIIPLPKISLPLKSLIVSALDFLWQSEYWETTVH